MSKTGRALVVQDGVPLRPKGRAESTQTTIDPIDRYVDMLVAERPGMPRKVVRERVKRDLEVMAKGHTEPAMFTYQWAQTEYGLRVSFKHRQHHLQDAFGLGGMPSIRFRWWEVPLVLLFCRR